MEREISQEKWRLRALTVNHDAVVPVGVPPDSDYFVKTVRLRRTSTYSIGPIATAQILEECVYLP